MAEGTIGTIATVIGGLLGIAVLLLIIVALPFIRKKRDEAFQGDD